ncbi:beta strand repeat-containing protein, partial [Paenibacillus periandrae]|uniref:beta strand repeat-containing protein n=1 Tax=Paenibacillus periandrae TaxID=1761741 RepID=UPI0023DD9F7F
MLMKLKKGISVMLVMLMVIGGMTGLLVPGGGKAYAEGFAGGQGSQSDPYQIATAAQLDEVRNHLDASFKLIADIDLNVSPYKDAQGWVPIGNDISPFTGNMNGKGYKITNLTINRSSSDYIGLFGATDSNSVITNIKLEDISVQGQNYVGGLVGDNQGTISNSYTTGNSTTVSVSGSQNVGGLVGVNEFGSISNSYATGNVNGSDYYAGGLVGNNYSGSISNSYATGSVNGNNSVGGLAGNIFFGSINNSYATGRVNGNIYVGGLVGNNINNYGTITNSFYNIDTTGQPSGNPANGIGQSTAEMKLESTYVNWDFSLDWYMLLDQYPQLWALSNITPTAVPTAALAVGTSAGTTRLNSVTSAMEYKVNSGSYNTVTGTTYVDNISVNAGDTISVRVTATAQQPKSSDRTLTVALADIKPAAAPTTAALAAGTNEGTTKLSGVTSAMEYSVNGADYLPIAGTYVDNISVSVTNTITVQVKATAQQPASLGQTLTVSLANIKPSSAATLTSTIGTVSTGGTANETITNIPNGTTLAVLKAAITPSANATFQVYDADGTTVAATLSTGKKVIVTAQDGTTKVTYTVTVNAALSTVATLTSTIGTVSTGGTANETITNIPNGTTL